MIPEDIRERFCKGQSDDYSLIMYGGELRAINPDVLNDRNLQGFITDTYALLDEETGNQYGEPIKEGYLLLRIAKRVPEGKRVFSFLASHDLLRHLGIDLLIKQVEDDNPAEMSVS